MHPDIPQVIIASFQQEEKEAVKKKKL